jgi:antitoxin ParD1/3/4
MIGRTTVNISITPELGAFLQRRVASGRYQTTSEVVREALRLLESEEEGRAQALVSLKAKLNRGAAEADRGELFDGDEVFAELKAILANRPVKRNAAPAKRRRAKA